jgi:RluA family pseudouridine synthase
MKGAPVLAEIRLSSPATREAWILPVLWEDQHLLALDKPPCLLTSPDRYDPTRPNLMALLHRDIARSAPWAAQRQIRYLANAHRLDFETSGVLLLARNKPALVELANQFGSEKPVKTYVALAQGTPAEDIFEVDERIGPHPARPGTMRVDPRAGKRALTRFQVLERFRDCALLQCQPQTGRTHQIRVHLRHQRLPLVGDVLYGGKPLLLSRLKPDYRFKHNQEERPLLGRVALHAESLTVRHPISGEPLTIRALWPKDLTVAVKYLRKFSLPAGLSSH